MASFHTQQSITVKYKKKGLAVLFQKNYHNNMKLLDQNSSSRRKKPTVQQPHLYHIVWIHSLDVDSRDAAELLRLSFRFREADIDKLIKKSRDGERTVIGTYSFDVARSKMAAARDTAAALRLSFPFLMERE